MEANTERERDNGRQEKYRVIKVWGTVKKRVQGRFDFASTVCSIF